ncbi:PREDICTED: cation/H(+) antiporter 15-like [Lupinus angustifolius]|uniref:cation/H(+) antiporter 15-like n=1 Tax=Lupinus angustifolius TaxID=3871 RepID=UPI00092EAD88|nr:PREDICTED: cation/H(+) antiporter 15-like [Lupinus angustifolius]
MTVKGPKLSEQGWYSLTISNPNDIWKSQNVLTSQVTTFASQVAFVLFTTRFIYYILRPLNQPLIVIQIIVGCLMSPDILGKYDLFQKLFPLSSVISSESIAHVGLIYYVFLIGLDMNLDTILKARKKVISIALAGTFIPMAMGAGIYTLLHIYGNDDLDFSGTYKTGGAYLFWTLPYSITGFPILAHILADLKLLYTGLGKVALTVAMISDFYNWVMFSLLTPFATHSNLSSAIYSLLCTIAFFLFLFFVLRPFLVTLIVRKTIQDEWDDYQLLYVVMGAFACALVTDVLGSHPIMGALVYGILIPRGKFTTMLIERSEDFVTNYLVPLFFFGCGMRLRFSHIFEGGNWMVVLAVVFFSCIPKILSTVIATYFLGMTIRDGVALGLLMNTKGMLAVIMLNIGLDKQILSHGSFTTLLLAVLVMTLMVPLIINAIYKPRKRYAQNKLRTIQNLKVDAELKVLACVYNTRHAKGMINLLEACNSIKVSPLHVFAVLLIEHTGNATALLAAHIEQPHHQQEASQALTKAQEDMENIASDFQSYVQENNNNNTKADTLVAVSSYSTIHEDLFSLAQEKQTTFILLPFHKHLSLEGFLESTNNAYKNVNQNVMGNAPCSVGIFVDRGLGSLFKLDLRVLVIFIGGPDDREALAVGWRMSKHQGIQLSMVRIILLGKAAEVEQSSDTKNNGLMSASLDNEKQKELDDEYVSSFRLKAVNNEDSISYLEKEVNSSEDITKVLKELDKLGFDLYIVGQGMGRDYIILSNLLKWADCPELGVIGDIIASNNFSSTSSLLVVQQYGFGGMVFQAKNHHPDEISADNDASEEVSVKVE